MKRRARLAASLAVLAALTAPRAAAGTAQEVILRAKPAAVLVTARVDAEVTVSCGAGATTVRPAPFVETGTGWLVDGRGWLVTNAHVVDPAHTVPPWVVHELKRKAVDRACVDPVLARQGLRRGQRPDVEDRVRATVDMGTVQAKVAPAIMVMLSNGRTVRGDVTKFSAPLLLDAAGKPLPESGRDLALLRIPDGTYPALAATGSDPRIGDPIHMIGFPGVVLAHELLGKTASVEASVTNGSVANRFRIKAKEVARMLEEGANPMLLDVRQPSAVTQSALRIPGATYIAPDALEKGQIDLDVDPVRTVVAYCT